VYPFVYRYQRLSGRNSSGSLTVWHRQSVSYTVGQRPTFVVGCFQVVKLFLTLGERQIPSVLGVNHQGSITLLTAVRHLSTYLINSLRPALNFNGYQMPLRYIQVGLRVVNVGFYARSSGTSLQILRHRRGLTQVKLPSRRLLWVDSNLLAVIGQHGNSRVKFIKQTKAGSRTRTGRRPSVRGVAMNPVDHPHGGGQGKTSGLGYSPWGQLSKGYRSRPRHLHGLQP